MHTRYKVALAAVAGTALGAAAIQGLHAQAKPPVYAVVEIEQITDAEGFKAIGQRSNAAAQAVFKDLGGRYLARTGNITRLDGTPPQRFIIIAFDSLDKAKAWDSAAAQQPVNDVRRKTTKSRVFIVEGM